MKTRSLDKVEIEEKEFFGIEEELTQTHYDLAKAVDENRLEEVKRFINAGININFILADVFPECCSPLNIAVNNLNVAMVQLLLRHGANPNLQPKEISSHDALLALPDSELASRSIVEVLMASIGNLSIMESLGDIEKKSLKFFGIKTPFKIKVINTPIKIQDAHQILDLLLCYGLKPDFEWTKPFEDSTKQLIDSLQYAIATSAIEKTRVKLIDIQLLPGIRRTLLSSAVKSIYWLRDHVKNSPSKNNVSGFVGSIFSIKDTIQKTVSKIDADKKDLLNDYRTIITEGGAILPIALIDIIIHYVISSFSFCHEIALTRKREDRTLEFWAKTEINKDLIDKIADKCAQYSYQYSQYEKATHHLKNLIGKKGQKILIEYLIDETSEPEVSSENNQNARLSYS